MPFAAGETVGAYRVIEQLGQGGMATVYKAYHPALDRYVALKVLHPAFREDASFLMRFQREAKVIAKLEHPHIVPIYDYAEHTGQPYLVMKFIEGETLKARLARGPLAPDEALRILRAVGAALSHAHRQGILHRDIKPSNILLTPSGEVYLADFGLARIAELGATTLSADMLLGTPHYISPEQGQGRRDLDAGTDIYSLGVVLYEIVVGRVPFTADTPFSIVHDHIFKPLPLPRSVNPRVPEAVERVLLKALAKERADRYADVDSLVTAFVKSVRGGGAAAATPAGTTTLEGKPGTPPAHPPAVAVGAATGKPAARKTPWWVWLLAAAGLCLCLGVAALLLSSNKGGDATPGVTDGAVAPGEVIPKPSEDTSPAREAAKYFEDGLRLLDAGDRAGAAAAFDQSRAIAADKAPFYLRLSAEKLEGRQEWVQALLFYVQALRNAPQNKDVRLQMQQAMYRSSGLADGGGPLQEVVKIAPEWAVGLAAWGRWELFNGQRDSGAKDLEKAQTLPQEPDAPLVRALWAEYLNLSGRATEAKTILREVLRDPRTPRWLNAEMNRIMAS
jgi:tRNA A-37 threonylcarbamoyl transferase component Bud32